MCLGELACVCDRITSAIHVADRGSGSTAPPMPTSCPRRRRATFRERMPQHYLCMLLSGMLKHPSGGENVDKVKRSSSSSSRGNSSSRMGMAVLPDSRDRVEVRRRQMRLKLIDLWIPDINSKSFHAIHSNMPFMALLLGLGDSYYENLALQTPPLVKCQ